jgi:hypothetical protein
VHGSGSLWIALAHLLSYMTLPCVNGTGKPLGLGEVEELAKKIVAIAPIEEKNMESEDNVQGIDLTDEQKAKCLDIMRDALSLLGLVRPHLTMDQKLAFFAGQYRHSAAGDTAEELGELADEFFADQPGVDLRDE